MNNKKLIFKVDIINKYCHEWLGDLPKNHNKKIKKQVVVYLTYVIENICALILTDIDGNMAGDNYENTKITEKGKTCRIVYFFCKAYLTQC